MERKGISNDMVVAEGDLYQKFLIQQLYENFSWLFTNVTRKVLLNQFFFANNFFFNLSGQYLITKLLLSCLLSWAVHPPQQILPQVAHDLLHNFLGHGHQHPPLFHIQGHQTSDYIPAVKLILNKISVATNIFWELNLKLVPYISCFGSFLS
jgi:hypothetical protein